MSEISIQEVNGKTIDQDHFGKFAAHTSTWLGSKYAFIGAMVLLVGWAVLGPAMKYSANWQLFINTSTTIITFLMVFLIQNTQNRDSRAINLKLNELIRAHKNARNQMIDIEDLSDIELDDLKHAYEKVRAACDCAPAKRLNNASLTALPGVPLRNLTFLCTTLLFTSLAVADPISVVHRQGTQHGFLVVKTDDGKVIATADQVTTVRGAQVRSKLTYKFRDGSVDEETTVFTQAGTFQVVSDHHIQKGPSFPKPIDLAFDVKTGMVTYHEFKDGKDEVKTDHVDMPNDLANGMVPTLLQDSPSGAEELKFSYIAATPKPRVVRLHIKPQGFDPIRIGGVARRARRYNIHIDLGGIAGAVAPVFGKQPDDIQVWILEDEVPAFVKNHGAFYDGGPAWNISLTSPTYSSETAAEAQPAKK